MEAFSGWAAGSYIGSCNVREAEVRRGKQYAFASFYQFCQVVYITSAIETCIPRLPDGTLKTAAKLGCCYLPRIALVVFPFSAAVTHENFHVSSRTRRICRLVSTYSGPLMRVIGIVSAIAMPLVYPSFGAGMLLAVLYEAARSGGLVPDRISLFMSNYGYILSACGTLVSGRFWMRLISAMTILEAFPTLLHMIQYCIDDSIKYVRQLANPNLRQWPLKAFEAPLQRHRQLDYNTIKKLFASDQITIHEIDPAHCSKGVFDIYTLPENKDFNHLLNHFTKIDWISRYEHVKRKCAKDERFKDFLMDTYNATRRDDQPPIELTDLQNTTPNSRWEQSTRGLQTVEACILQLAQQANLSKEQYLANWLHDQMQGLVDGLLGKIFVPGSPEDLQVAKAHAPKIIAYLDSLLPQEEGALPKDEMFEDLLMKMAIEGGRYCTPGVKRATLEAVRLIAQQKIEGAIQISKAKAPYHGFTAMLVALGALVGVYQASSLKIRLSIACVALAAVGALFKAYTGYQALLKSQADEADQVINKHDIQIRGALEQLRERIMQGVYHRILGGAKVALDEHIMDAFTPQFVLGFLPMDPLKRRNIGVLEIFSWNVQNKAREEMMAQYAQEMDDDLRICLEEMGNQHAVEYFLDLINKNSLLTQEQKQEFIDALACDTRAPKFSEVHRGFRRLILVSLGILKL